MVALEIIQSKENITAIDLVEDEILSELSVASFDEIVRQVSK